MSDLERLNEALTTVDSILSLILHRHNVDPELSFQERQRALEAIDVIRRTDLLAKGERVKWCEEHGSYFQEREPDQYSMCMAMLFEDNWNTLPEPEDCRIVSKLLIATPTEEES